MGWFSTTPTEARAEAVRTGTAVPTREERARCWASRDAYFGCLDAANIIDPLADASGAKRVCGAQSSQFEKDCAAQWVTHFKKWRVANYQKEQRLKALRAEGAQEMAMTPQIGGVGKN